MSKDLFGGAAEVWIVSGGKGPRSLSSIIGADSSMSFVESMRIKIALFEIMNVEINLNPLLDLALRLLSSQTLGMGFSAKVPDFSNKSTEASEQASAFAKSLSINHMIVRLHYGGVSSPYYKTIMHVPEIDVGADGISIVLKGTGILFQTANNFTNKSKKDKRSAAIDKMLGGDFILEIPPGDTKAKKALDAIEFYTSAQSDLEIVTDIVKKSECVLLYAGSDTKDGRQKMIIKSRDYTRKKGNGRFENVPTGPVFAAFKQIDPNNGIYPLLSMQVPIANLFMPGAIYGASSIKYSRDNKQTQQELINGKSLGKSTDKLPSQDGTMAGGRSKAKQYQSQTSATVASSDSNGINYPVPDREGTGLVDKVKGVFHSFFEKAFEYHLTSVGIVDLLPGQLISIDFMGVQALSGQYDLASVEHSISSSGVETSMQCFRTGGVLSMIDQGVGEMKEKVTQKKKVKSKKNETKVVKTSSKNKVLQT